MPVPPSDELIEQFLSGDLEPDLARQVHEYLNANPGRRGIMAGIRASIRGELFSTPPAVEAALARFHALVERTDAERRDRVLPFRRDHAPAIMPTGLRRAPGGSSPVLAARPVRPPVRRVWATIGACLLVFASLAGLVKKVRTHGQPLAVGTKVYRTANAQRATIRLPDGSTVVLGPASQLSMSPDFATRRDVMVQGEGYFTVHPDPARPFLVHSGNAVVHVLGTTFTVRRYASDAQLRVAVVEGRVLVRAVGQPTSAGNILPGGTLGVMDSTGTFAITSRASMDEYTAWTKGQLIFRSTPLHEVLAEIERQYDLTLQFADTTQLQKRFSAQFGDEPVGQVLDAVALAFHAQYTRSGPNNRIVKFVPAQQLIQHAAPIRLPHSSTQEIQYGR